MHYRAGDEAKAQLLASVVPAPSSADRTVGSDVLVVLGPGFKGIGRVGAEGHRHDADHGARLTRRGPPRAAPQAAPRRRGTHHPGAS